MEEKYKEEHIEATPNMPLTEDNIYKRNLEANKNMTLLFDFVSTVTKIDVCFETLQGYLYWVGNMEFFVWNILIALFVLDIKYMAKVWFFLPHIPRGAIGLIILFYLPKTHEVIESIENYESNTLEEIREKISENYIKILNTKEKFLKPLLIAYFILTIIVIIVDIVMFCVITPDFGLKKVRGQFFAVLLLVNIGLIIGDFVYILFFSGFKYFFPPAQNEAAHKAVMGFFTQLKVGIATGFTNIAKKISKKPSTENQGNDPRNIDINNEQNIMEGNATKEEVSIKIEDNEQNIPHIEENQEPKESINYEQ